MKRIMAWALAILVILALALAAFYFWAVSTQSVATLDRLDRWTAEAGAELAVGPSAYGDHPQQRLYVWRPSGLAADARAPVVVFYHGGGWNRGDPRDYGFVGRALARHGYVTVIAGYRLVPEGRFPAMLEDSAAALRWTHDNIAPLGGDAGRIAVMGHSAGAYNAIMLALDPQWLTAEDLAPDTIRAAIGLSGPYDFAPFTSDSAIAAFAHIDRAALTQPITFAEGATPPMLLLTGDADETVEPRNTRELAARVPNARTVYLEGVGHAGPIMQFASPFARDQRTQQAVLTFLTDMLADRDAPPVSVPVQP